MDALLHDIRYGLRLMAKKPAFTLIAVVTLALGIGANTAIFSVVNAVLLRPLPYSQPEQLVKIFQAAPSSQKGSAPTLWSYPRFEVLRDNSHSFAAVAACNQASFSLTGTDEPERLQAELVSANYFSLLGLATIEGRPFTQEEDIKGNAPTVAVLSYALWQRRFGGDSKALGKTIELDKHAFTIVGVMPAGFNGQQGTAEVWVPITDAPLLRYPRVLANAMNYWFEVVARLDHGVTIQQAQQEMAGITEQIESVYPSPSNRGPGGEARPAVTLVPWRDANVDPAIRRSFLILLAAVGFVLLIACANVANLLLARAVSREKEIAIRLAIGASRSQIVRQLITESLLLAVAGGVIGLLIAMWGVDLLTSFKPSDDAQFWSSYTRTFDFFKIHLDGRVLVFNFLLALATGIIFGLVPALQASHPNLNEALKETTSGSATAFRPQWRLSTRSVLVAGQITLSFVLLASAGLMIRSLVRLQSVNLGFEPAGVTTMSLFGRGVKLEFYKELLSRVKAMPGVESASVASTAPLLGYSSMTIMDIKDQPAVESAGQAIVAMHNVSPDYFATLGIRLRQGRVFTDQDRIGAPRVAVINQAAAERFFAGGDATGKRIKPYIDADYPGAEDFVEIVGIVDDVKYGRIEERAEPNVYLSFLQPTDSASTLIVRSRTDKGALVAAIRREALTLDRNVPLTRVLTMEERSAEVTSRTRFIALLLGLFAALALMLSGIGIYGVMAYSVLMRTREIGIRMALGARPGDVFRLVLREGAILILVGLVAGIGAAFAATRILASQLYDVSSTDPLTFGLIAFLVTGAAVLACYLPARRAAKVDPMVALRYE
ncbi:MAG TPA: ABC transporter permease [Blastocatellia bacterium]|nr:ABC transporter permease [Blastocatellia bacterium]